MRQFGKIETQSPGWSVVFRQPEHFWGDSSWKVGWGCTAGPGPFFSFRFSDATALPEEARLTQDVQRGKDW